MNVNNKVSFTGRYNFLQNQRGLHCACCGKTILSEPDVKDIYKSLQGKKGLAVAEILAPYIDRLDEASRNFLQTMLACVREPRFRDWNFRQLSILGKEPKIYTPDPKETLNNLLKSIRFSVEHTNPRSKTGINHYSNYLPMDIGCNSGRSSITYSDMAAQNPDFIGNLRKSLLEIKDRILSDKSGTTHYGINLPEDYIPQIKENIISQGLDRKLFEDI